MTDTPSTAAALGTLFLVDRSARLRMTFSGAGAKAALGGLVTSDVAALAPGQGQRAVALTPKGRVIALVRVFDRGADLLVDTDAAAGDGFATMIKKYVNPRLAKYAVVTQEVACLGVYGGLAATAAPVARVLGADASALEALAPLAGQTHGDGDQGVFIVHSSDLAPAGLDLFGTHARIESVRAALVADGAVIASAEEAEVARVTAGVPEWGREMDGETIPQEAMLDELGAISFTKGCYTGQEVVARVHFRGHVNRHLRWLSTEQLLPVGAPLLDADEKTVGEVRTSVFAPARGPLAVAMVRREFEPGAEIRARTASGDVMARVIRMGDLEAP